MLGHLPHRLRLARLRAMVRGVHGRVPRGLGPRDLVVACLVKDGEPYIDQFLRHYRAAGAAHVVVLDNGSTDATVEIAASHHGVTVLACDAPYGRYEKIMKRHLLDRFGRGCWCLIADIDEFLDWPDSGAVSLPRLLDYLNGRGYTAVTAQMLDLFAPGPASTWPAGGAEMVGRCTRYDISELTVKEARISRSTASNPAIKRLGGGIRQTALATHVGLTKVPLLFRDGGARSHLTSAHTARGARIADLSVVLRHYKFLRGFGDLLRAQADARPHPGGSARYRSMLTRFRQETDMDLERDTTRSYAGPDSLVEAGFLVVSDAWRRFAAEEARAASA